jgi:hypothetical protein
MLNNNINVNDIMADDTMPGIRNNGIMVAVSFTRPPSRVADKQVREEAEAEHNVRGALHVTRRLYPKSALAPIADLENRVHLYLRKEAACQFGETSAHIFHKSKALELTSKLNEFEREHAALVQQFIDDWNAIILAAQGEQGDRFDPSKYPDVNTAAAQFSMSVTFLPVGRAAASFFSDMEQDVAIAVATKVRESERRMVNDAIRAPLERVFESILNIHDKLSRADSRVHESLMGTLSTLIGTLPALNVTNDPTVTKVYEFCRLHVLRPTESVRDSDSTERQRVVGVTTKLLNRVGLDPKDVTGADSTARRAMTTKAVDALMQDISAAL